MLLNQKNSFQTYGYRPAELREGKRWEIVYYVTNPETGKLKRIQVAFNKVKNIKDRRKQAKLLCAEITARLVTGWNPLLEQEKSKGFVKLFDAIKTYRTEKFKEIRKDSIRSYDSMLKTFENWLISRNEKDLICISFEKRHAYDLLDYISTVKGVSNRTYNNYLKYYRVLFFWMMERDYCKVNYFEKIKTKIKEEPKEKYIRDCTREKIENYLRKNNHPFLCVALLCYGSFLRPKEILSLKPDDFILESKKVRISASIAKNRKTNYVDMPDFVFNEIEKLDIKKIPFDNYVFSENFEAGKVLKNARDSGRFWSNMLDALNIPEKDGFYSLTQTGITD
jgi:integrase